MGGRNRKRLRGLKVSRKLTKPNQMKIRNSVLNCEVKKAYDKTKSPMENLKAFGLDPEINHFNSRSTPQTSSISPEDVPKGQSKAKLAAFVGMGVVSGSDGIRLINKKRSDTVMSDFESTYAKNNIEKHKTNYKAMERDIKLNFMQHSEYKMQKLCERYLAIEAKKPKA